ncbi:PH domain-containing protein [Corynebacterium sanguinis]|uniref:PH domain-containing protein n=1 Tax=Corynebacterium sanguinis TaxID=2594913 RepID=UPI0011A1754A|nr:PH domain-containing protein [Corynebacterium sanguinis]MCT1413818.1 PH domain-containing protein [Corynebacterium sanguinis]MDN8576838.1 PH domain-containing protein [Corynebacterium sanguinis]TVS24016.1 hypothetical protein EKI50_02485 [Corynebacterium sanguinis]
MDRKVHRITPLLRAWGVLFALVVIAAVNFLEPLYTWVSSEHFAAFDILRGVGIFVVGVAVLFAVSQLWWSRMGYGIGEEELGLKRGVFTTHVRTARFDRIQAVDVVEPLAARIFGLAAVRVEAAGGGDSAIEIAYLPKDEAERVRAEIMRAVAREGAEVDTAADAQDFLVAPVPIHRSLIGTLLRVSTLVAAAFTALPLATNLSPAAAIPVIIGVLPSLWRMIDQSWRFQAVRGDEVVNVTFGLANRRRQAVPLDRIHAVSLTQPPLWRPLGWWEVKVNVAGYKTSGDGGTLTLLPVGTLDEALAVVRALSPLQVGELGEIDPASADAHVRTPRRARWVSPVDWRRQSLLLRDGTAVVTSGRLSRRYSVVEVPHIQELTSTQGPLQWVLGLAHVRLDLVPGPVSATVRDLDIEDARWVVDTLRARALPPVGAASIELGCDAEQSDGHPTPAREGEEAPGATRGGGGHHGAQGVSPDQAR